MLRTSAAAVALALGGMLGAGVFVGVGAASAAAGGLALLGLPLAVLAAVCCAVSSAESSESYRGPGAAYGCVRARLGIVPARIAASSHFVGYAALIAALAGAIGEYAVPGGSLGISLAVPFVVVLAATTGLRLRGTAAWLWLLGTCTVLGLVVVTCLAISPPERTPGVDVEPLGIVAAAGTLFVVFLGFERLTAPDDESQRFPRVTIRRGLIVSLVAATMITAVVAVALLRQFGGARLGLAPAPLRDVLAAAGAQGLEPWVGVGAALVMLPVLLGAVETLRSTALAVVRDRDLPAGLAKTGSHGTPWLLDMLGAAAAGALTALLDPAAALALGACCVLVHYAFANAGVRILLAEDRTWPQRTACLGMALCVVLAVSMPVPALTGAAGAAVLGPLVGGLVSRRWS
ncbi:amino acid permease [Allosaccharopolyspora coralli]|uniref:Amino acid permease n=1 Tax=Allosaccharopolyspora coralli TaxID=2665642 RepID=A0A5Q3QDW8_9PSEU|nr:amino acid permease [Allosaccharopolyspora coralli]